jgi:hypothetical protein
MAVTATPVFVQTPVITPQNFVQGTDAAGTYKTIYTAGANGSKVTGIIVATDDGSATHVLTLVLTRSATDYYIGAYTLPISSGTSGAAANVDMLNGGPSSLIVGLPRDNDGQKYLFLKSGDTLRMTFATALTAGKRIDVNCIGADF